VGFETGVEKRVLDNDWVGRVESAFRERLCDLQLPDIPADY
jgi:hypothetical protein